MFFRKNFLVPALASLSPGFSFARAFEYSTSNGPVSASLRLPKDEEQILFEFSRYDILCDVACERIVSSHLLKIFELSSRREFPSSSTKDADSSNMPAQKAPEYHMRSYPLQFAECCRGISKELEDVASRTVATLRWRLNLDQGPQPVVSHPKMEFSFEGAEWFEAPFDVRASITLTDTRILTDELIAQIVALVDHGEGEPLPHSLFREAWSLKDTNPKSSLLIGVTAAEVALKQYIAHVVPDARWLVENLPSPPLHKIITEYLPNLPHSDSAEKSLHIPEEILNEVKSAVTLRNQVTHRGHLTLEADSLERKLEAIRNLIWILDYRSGHLWALEYVQLGNALSRLF